MSSSHSERHLGAVPDRPEPDVYGHIDFFDGIKTCRLTVEVDYDRDGCPGADIVIEPSGWVLRHPFDAPRESTEEERAAVGWTW